MPTLQQLKYIIAVDQWRNFSKAAEACHVSQPSLSQQIREVENELGVILFDRSQRHVATTEKGVVLLEQARVILHESQKLLQMSLQEKAEIKGAFTLAVIPTLAPYLIPLFLKNFAEGFPKVQLKIQVLKTEDIIAGLKQESLDAGLLVSPLEEDSLIENVLFYEPLWVFAHAEDPLSKLSKVSEEDLSSDRVWLLGEGHCFRNQMLKLCGLRSRTRPFKNVDFGSADFETLIQLVQQNGGYTLLPELCVRSIKDRPLAKNVRAFQKPLPVREVSLVHTKSVLKLDIAKALQNCIVKEIPEDLQHKIAKSTQLIGIL
jgi:LysR family hydrogen peroxide-inducible transcriptional activator